MNGEIITIGTELLLGDTLNTNSQYLSKELSNMGINIIYQSVVGDNLVRLKEVLTTAIHRSDIIITTGGLGPTQDDLTKETLSELLELPLTLHKPSLEKIKLFFKSRNGKMTQNNIKQAYFPKESIIVPNDQGTAPGNIIEKDDKIIILLPGPPRELIPMFENHIMPYILKKENKSFYSRYYKIIGIGESALENTLIEVINNQTNPTIATYAGDNEVMIRLTANAKDKQTANTLLDSYEKFIYDKLEDHIYGGREDTLEQVTANLLIQNNISISIAESCTGGLIASRLTKVPNISKVFHSAIVCYSNHAKENIIGVPSDILKNKGAVSSETAEELCRNLYNKTKTDIVLSVTGVAGPGGGSNEKPVGLVYICLLYKNKANIHKFNLQGSRQSIQKQTAQLALNLLRKKVISNI